MDAAVYYKYSNKINIDIIIIINLQFYSNNPPIIYIVQMLTLSYC